MRFCTLLSWRDIWLCISCVILAGNPYRSNGIWSQPGMLLIHGPLFLSLTEIGICLNKKGMGWYKIKLYLRNRFECVFALYCLAATSYFVLVVSFCQGTLTFQMVFNLNQAREYQRGKYHCTVDLLFDWFGLVRFANKNKNFQLSYSWFQTSQTGGQWYSDTSAFSIPCTGLSFCHLQRLAFV